VLIAGNCSSAVLTYRPDKNNQNNNDNYSVLSTCMADQTRLDKMMAMVDVDDSSIWLNLRVDSH